MKISQYIEELEKIKTECGDLDLVTHIVEEITGETFLKYIESPEIKEVESYHTEYETCLPIKDSQVVVVETRSNW